MGILSRLMGTAGNTAARTGRSAGRATGRPTTGRRGMKAATPRAGGMRRGSATPAASGGLGRLIGSFTGRR
ncbi:hypothetical protein HGI15_07640 [Modestobacter lapidis]|nr:hypothetical protein [Modestobacter lapidis]